MEVLQAVALIKAGEILLKQAKQLLFYEEHIPARTCNWQESRLNFSVKKMSLHKNTLEMYKEKGTFGIWRILKNNFCIVTKTAIAGQ